MQSHSHHLASVLASLVRCCWAGEPASVCHFGSVHHLSPSQLAHFQNFPSSIVCQRVSKGPLKLVQNVNKVHWLPSQTPSQTHCHPKVAPARKHSRIQQVDMLQHVFTSISSIYVSLCFSFFPSGFWELKNDTL